MKLFRPLALLLLAAPLYAADPQPRTVSVRGKLKLSAVLKQIGEQAGAAVQSAEDLDDPEIDVDLDKVPFWKALDAVAVKAQARPYVYGQGNVIRLVKAGKEGNPFVSYDGLFRVSLQRLTATNHFDAGGRKLVGTIEVVWEPHLLPIYMDSRAVQLLVHDARGKPLAFDKQGSTLVPVAKGLAMEVDLPLPTPPRGDDKLALLKGELTVRAPSKMLTFNFDNLNDMGKAKLPLVKQEGETTCTVREVKLGARAWTVELEVKIPEGGPAFESFQTWTGQNELYLVRTKDRVRIGPKSSELIDSTSRKAILSYTFEPAGKPEDFLLLGRAPASIVEMPIRFEFKNVPLP